MSLTAEQGKQACHRVMKFTLGPWHVEDFTEECSKNGWSIGIRTEAYYSSTPGKGWIADVHQQFTSFENGMANAKLIAAAPELLEALIGLVADVRNKPNDARYATRLKIADAAIDKALK